MSDIIKHVFKFQEARRTVYLHAANKDALGRHRGHVLYGMKLTPTGTNVHIGPGALYTAFGTRLYLDVQTLAQMTLDLNNPGVVNIAGQSIFSASYNNKRPLVVAIIAKFDVYGAADPADLPQAKQVESADEVTADVQFIARLVPFDRATVNPTFNIVAQDPIFMNKGDQSDAGTADYGTKNTWSNLSVKPAPEGTIDGDSIHLDEIVLGYIIVGAPYDLTVPVPLGSYPPVILGTAGVWANGIACVQCRNSWEALEDFLGADVLWGRNDRMVLTAPNGISALNQIAGAWNTSNASGGYAIGTAALMLSPKFGTGGISGGVYATNYANYRLPSFMRDGDSIIQVMRRLDYLMRLWMDRTGDQKLIGQIQDGTETGQTFMSPLLNIQNYFDGGINPGSNKNATAFKDLNAGLGSHQTPGTDPVNTVLKSGPVPHADVQATDINSILVNAYGDTHYAAIRALDIAVWNILQNIFGLAVPRSNLRRTDDWTIDGIFTDTPINLTTYPTSVVSGITFPYVGSTIQKLIPAVNELLFRSERTVGSNLLQNAGFWAAISGVPIAWDRTGTFVFTQTNLGGSLFNINFSTWSNLGTFQQTLALTNNATRDLLKTAGHVSASLMVQNDVQLTMYLISVASAVESIICQIDIPAQTGSPTPRTVSMTAELSGASAALLSGTSFIFRVKNTAPLSAVGTAIKLFGAAVNAGMPNPCPASRMPMDFLSRDGGVNAAMRGNLVMGGLANDIYFGAALNSGVWAANTESVITNTPTGTPPTVGPAGTAVHQHLTFEAAKAALDIIDNRTIKGVGPNWCHNPTGTETGSLDPDAATGWDQSVMPPYWTTNATFLDWRTVKQDASNSAYPGVPVTFMDSLGNVIPDPSLDPEPNNGVVGQYIIFRSEGGWVQNHINLPKAVGAPVVGEFFYPGMLVADLMTAGGLLSASCLITNNHSTNGVRLEVYHRNPGSSQDRFMMASNVIPPRTSGVMAVTAKVSIPDLGFGYLLARIVSASYSTPAVGIGNQMDINMFGICVNAGMPQRVPGWDAMRADYLPRTAGANYAMLGPLDMGNKEIKNLARSTVGSNAARVDQIIAYNPPVTFISVTKSGSENSSFPSVSHNPDWFAYSDVVNPTHNCLDADLHIDMGLAVPGIHAVWRMQAKVFACCSPGSAAHKNYFKWKWSQPTGGLIAPVGPSVLADPADPTYIITNPTQPFLGGYTTDEFIYEDYNTAIYPTPKNKAKWGFNADGLNSFFNRDMPSSNPLLRSSASHLTAWQIEADYILDIPAGSKLGFVWCANGQQSTAWGHATNVGGAIVTAGIITLTRLAVLP